MEEKKYPIGGYAPGNYYYKCVTCSGQFQGDKRSFQCEPCGEKSENEWNSLTEDEKIERQKRNVEIYNEFINSDEYKQKINRSYFPKDNHESNT